MKRALPILTMLVVLAAGCRKAPVLSLSDTKQKQVIAIQPLDDFNVQDINAVLETLRQYYHKSVVVLQAVTMPQRWRTGADHLYAADSILTYLSSFQNDSIVDVVGFTHKPLFTIKEERAMPVYDAYIIGLGYQPGNACVVSDYKMLTENSALYINSMRKAIMHELGHNMGLPHCADNGCIMSETNGGSDYCAACKKKLNQ